MAYSVRRFVVALLRRPSLGSAVDDVLVQAPNGSASSAATPSKEARLMPITRSYLCDWAREFTASISPSTMWNQVDGTFAQQLNVNQAPPG
jgi:hypothetical protein